MRFFRPRIRRAALWCVVWLGSAGVVLGQQGPALPAIRQLGPRLAVTKDSLGLVSGIRQLSDGRVIINDIGKHKLILYDSVLSHGVVIADSTLTTKKAYGAARGGILAYHADTTFFVDPVALSIQVIDPHGTIVRTIAPPRPRDAGALTLFYAGIDAAGRVVYRGVLAGCSPQGGCGIAMPAYGPTPADSLSSTIPAYALHDSVAIIRGDFATQVIDTAGFLATPFTPRLKLVANPDGSVTDSEIVRNLFPAADDWAVVADGSVAFVRAQDYHIDWVNADGSRSSTPRIAHDWHRLSDSEKTAIVDSAMRVSDSTTKIREAQQATTDSINKAKGNPVQRQRHSVTVWPDPLELPDYRPVNSELFGFVKADAENNLWILVSGRTGSQFMTAIPFVYDIVNRQGKLIDRVQLPSSLTLAAFGPGVAYLTSREGTGTVIVKYRIR